MRHPGLVGPRVTGRAKLFVHERSVPPSRRFTKPPPRAGVLTFPSMPVCKACAEEVDEVVSVKVAGKTKKLCEECAEIAEQEQEILEQSESAVQGMMGFKGRR